MRLLGAPREDERLEFKEAKNRYDFGELCRYCVALANEGGGRIILGVSDKKPRGVVGTGAFQSPPKVCAQLLDKLGFRVDPEEIEHPDGRLLIFHVPSRPIGTAYNVDGAYLMRSGASTVSMSEDRLRAIFSEGKPDWLSEMARVGLSASPEIAVRELVANALIHQDFTEAGTSVVVEVYVDRMEVSSPGRPFIQPERFIDEYQSRNERLADIMRRLGICEEKGSGIDRVVHSAEEYQLPAPDFRVGERRTTVVLFAHKDFQRMDLNDRIRACYQHCCLRYITNAKMTNQSLRDRFQLPEARSETVSRIIRETVEKNLVKPDNPESTSKRYARYVPFWA